MIGEIKIYSNNKLIKTVYNTVTKSGRYIFGEMLSTNRFIDTLFVSSLANTGITQVDNPAFVTSDFDIDKHYTTVDTVNNELNILYEAVIPTGGITTVKSIGLKSTLGTVKNIVTVATTDLDLTGLTNVYMSYKLKIRL